MLVTDPNMENLMLLSDAACRNAKLKPGAKITKLKDGGGLFLVLKAKAKLWWLSYRYGGKPKTLSLGKYPTVSLSEARERALGAKKVLAVGTDPNVAKKAAKTEETAASDTFELLARDYLNHQRNSGRAPATMAKLEWLLGLSFSGLGRKKINDIEASDILQVVRKVEQRKRYDTAHRLRSVIGTVFRFAIASGRAKADPTYALRGALVSHQTKHRAAIVDRKAFGALLRAIDGFDGQITTIAALQLMALLFPRPGELRAAEWEEFDLEAAVWEIPADRTKMRRAHRVPLSRQAVAILKGVNLITGLGRFVFPSVRTTQQPMSENTLNAALRRLGYSKEEMTAHGFRSSASTLLNESGEWHADAIERQLAHVERDDVRRAYARGEHWEQRVQMMQRWADQLDHLKLTGQVAPVGHKLSVVAA